jgi:hypothetical protein
MLDTLKDIAPFLDFLNKIGPFIGGVALMAGAVAAWLTLFIVNRRANRLTWVDGFRVLYAEFWREDTIADVRLWFASDVAYGKIAPIIEARLDSADKNTLNEDSNKVLEKIDQFCALLVRIELFSEVGLSKRQRKLWHAAFGQYWIRRINSGDREALRKYIIDYWPGVTLDPANRPRRRYS